MQLEFVRIAVRMIFADIQHFAWCVCLVEAKTSAFLMVQHSRMDAIVVGAAAVAVGALFSIGRTVMAVASYLNAVESLAAAAISGIH